MVNFNPKERTIIKTIRFADTETVKAGTPIDKCGNPVNDGTAVGILVYDVTFAGSHTGILMASGFIDLAAAEESCGLTISDEVKAALPDVYFDRGRKGISPSASDIGITDIGGYYTGTSVEDALQEIGAELAGTPVIEPTSGTATIDPNKFYDFGEQAAIAVTLGEPVEGIVNEYSFEFVSGTTPATLSVTPASGTIAWVGGEPTIEASKRYQVSILNNMAVIVGA